MARPHVHLNCAVSLDGKIAAPGGEPLRLSDDADWRRVALLRAESDAILVGVETIIHDDPSLTPKPDLAPTPPGHRLLRVVLDTRGRIPPRARVLSGGDTVVVTGPGVSRGFGKAAHLEVPLDGDHVDLAATLSALSARGVRRLLVEGGGTVLRAFVKADLVDRFTVFQAPVLVGGDGPSIWPGRPTGHGRRFHVENVVPFGKGVLWTFRP